MYFGNLALACVLSRDGISGLMFCTFLSIMYYYYHDDSNPIRLNKQINLIFFWSPPFL